MPAELEGAEVVPWDTVARYPIPTEIEGEFGPIFRPDLAIFWPYLRGIFDRIMEACLVDAGAVAAALAEGGPIQPHSI